MTKPLIIANWKMNPQSLSEAKMLFNSIRRGVKSIKNAEIVICPPFIYLTHLLNFKSYALNPKIGVQDCFWEEKGAYTGEVSCKISKGVGVEYVIIGHSERRKYFKETDEMISKKIEAALKAGLKLILCIDKISQIPKDIKDNFIIAYEPISAIGTGKPYSWEKAKEMKNKIQKILGKKIKILYGGSVNSENANNYIKQAGFQGLLIGSASLNAKEFVKIVKNIFN
jgi:triosephosphate isomerase